MLSSLVALQRVIGFSTNYWGIDSKHTASWEPCVRTVFFQNCLDLLDWLVPFRNQAVFDGSNLCLSVSWPFPANSSLKVYIRKLFDNILPLINFPMDLFVVFLTDMWNVPEYSSFWNEGQILEKRSFYTNSISFSVWCYRGNAVNPKPEWKEVDTGKFCFSAFRYLTLWVHTLVDNCSTRYRRPHSCLYDGVGGPTICASQMNLSGVLAWEMHWHLFHTIGLMYG